jgi:hypothetical protein
MCDKIFTAFTIKMNPKLIFVVCKLDSKARVRLYKNFCDNICTLMPNLSQTEAENLGHKIFTFYDGSFNEQFIVSKLIKLSQI